MQRNTRQREVIREVLVGAEHPLKPGEVAAAAQEAIPALGVATVYRNINRLVEEGWLRTVAIPGDSPRYERAQDDHHHFFRCNDCGRVFRVPGCAGDLRKLVPTGFDLDEHDLVLYGRCAECVSAATA